MRKIRNRPAIAMIELIFAIVIMGIVLMSAPMLISTAASTTSVALQQEGINEGSSRISMILTYAWDQNDINDSCIPPVLHVTAGDSELNAVAATGRRVGVPLQTNSRTFKCGNMELNASLIGQEGTLKDDIDDFTNTVHLVLDPTGTGGHDYIENPDSTTGSGTNINIVTTIAYTSDGTGFNGASMTYNFSPGGGSNTNIKSISVVLKSNSTTVSELQKTIKLNAFSCNIGGYEYESRVF